METTLTLGKVYIQTRDGLEGRMWPPNLNARLHWLKRSKWNQKFKHMVWGLVMEQKKNFGKIPYARAKIVVTFYTCRPMDFDNSATSAKPLMDGLKMAGVIVDDNQGAIEPHYSFIKVSTMKEQKTTIKITPL